MSLGASIFTFVVGAVLYFATSFSVSNVDIDTVGIILMAAGAVGFVISLFAMMNRNRSTVVTQDGRGNVSRTDSTTDSPIVH